MRLIKHDKKVRIEKVRDEATGKVVGATVEHKDGRKHAVARPDTVKARSRMDR